MRPRRLLDQPPEDPLGLWQEVFCAIGEMVAGRFVASMSMSPLKGGMRISTAAPKMFTQEDGISSSVL
jgi:hypothetical protein